MGSFWKPVGEKNELIENDPVTAILPIKEDSIIITTLKSGLYLLENNKVSKLAMANNNLFAKDRIYKACQLKNNRIALATNNNGVYIIDQKGNIIQSFSEKTKDYKIIMYSVYIQIKREISGLV